jgi:hypothetical protein
MKRCITTLLLLATIAVVAREDAYANAQSVDVEKAARVKAAYLLNFVRYTQWPDQAFDEPDSPILLTEVGECENSDVLAEVIRRSEPIGGRPVVLQHAPYARDEINRQEFYRSLEESQLVYICSLGPEPVPTILDHLKGSDVLTVGDTPDFVQHGGMIGFVLEENRILFEASPKAIQRSHVTVSAKVLKLAKIVDGGGEQ